MNSNYKIFHPLFFVIAKVLLRCTFTKYLNSVKHQRFTDCDFAENLTVQDLQQF
jgi:hypothetical protein